MINLTLGTMLVILSIISHAGSPTKRAQQAKPQSVKMEFLTLVRTVSNKGTWGIISFPKDYQASVICGNSTKLVPFQLRLVLSYNSNGNIKMSISQDPSLPGFNKYDVPDQVDNSTVLIIDDEEVTVKGAMIQRKAIRQVMTEHGYDDVAYYNLEFAYDDYYGAVTEYLKYLDSAFRTVEFVFIASKSEEGEPRLILVKVNPSLLKRALAYISYGKFPPKTIKKKVERVISL